MSNVLVAYGSKHGATAEIAEAVAARGHVVFGGRVPEEPSNFIERSMLQKAKPEHRDLRDWDVIRDWAAGIASQLGPPGPPPAAPVT
jgi:menaquinone-dependent protoporphyrinogen IX oxidase